MNTQAVAILEKELIEMLLALKYQYTTIKNK